MAYRPPYLPLWPMANFTINHDILYAEPAHVPGSCHQWMEVRGTYLPFVIPPPTPLPNYTAEECAFWARTELLPPC